MASLTRALRAKQTAADKIRAMYAKNLPPKTRAHTILTEKEVDENSKLFNYFDRNRDKFLDRNEYRDLVKYETSFMLQNPNLDDVFSITDANDDGRVSLEEFMNQKSLGKERPPSHLELIHMFNMCDQNLDGHICFDEFKSLWYQIGEDIQRKDLKRIFSEADTDGDRQITKHQFIDIVIRHTKRAKRQKS